MPGFGPKMAAAIKEALEAQPQGEAINMATGEVTDLDDLSTGVCHRAAVG